MVMRLVLAVFVSVGLAACGGGGETTPATPPAAPTNVTAEVVGDQYLALNATVDPAATSVNIYWKIGTGVSKANGTKLVVTTEPQLHTGLTNGTEYCYVVTALAGGAESADSAEYCATPVAATEVADPLLGDQWHLANTGQLGGNFVAGIAGADINVTPAWVTTRGEDVRIAIVDDGLEVSHEDLATNMAANGLSHNYDTLSSDPSETAEDNGEGNGHGTSCAGIAAARDLNGLGGSGVAPRATLLGFNLLQNSTSLNIANAMGRSTDVSSNSWGPADGTGKIIFSPAGWTTAIESGITSGRGGKGIVYTWAAGNGRGQTTDCPTCNVDNSNYDGQANYHGVIAVASVNDQDKQSSYSESGANLWVSAPGGEFCFPNTASTNQHAITTTDRTGNLGHNTGSTTGDYSTTNKYTRCMNGTSSATPEVSGVVALMLAANPDLSWRDVKIILAATARTNDFGDADWVLNHGTPQYYVNHKYGFGVVDAGAAVAAAAAYTSYVPTQKTYAALLTSPALVIPDGTGTPGSPVYGASAGPTSINVSSSGITSIEFVEITFSAANHTYAGDLDITLTSPSGTVSKLATTHGCASNQCTAFSGWVFGSARHLGEVADGSWTLTVKDGALGDTGTFQSWMLKFYGH